MSIDNFDVMKAMVDEDNEGITLAPLNNIVRAVMTKAGTEVTIGVPGNMVTKIMAGSLVGGLILMDKEQFNATKARLLATPESNLDPE